mmetsp:Transcript_13975/g.23103  ORF Transcript_13975/g.23103 Transcript_13975/m.23103 type:complete len:106 (+) Transcript_13975:429-746(+)
MEVTGGTANVGPPFVCDFIVNRRNIVLKRFVNVTGSGARGDSPPPPPPPPEDATDVIEFVRATSPSSRFVRKTSKNRPENVRVFSDKARRSCERAGVAESVLCKS